MLCLIILALGPWAYRNHLALGRWIWLTTNNGITLYDGFNPDATGASDQSFLQAPSMRALLFLNELERDQYLRQAAGDWIADTWRKDPRRLVDLTLAKLGRTWTPVPLSQDYGGRPLYRYAAAAYCVPLFVLTLIGLLRGPLPRSAKALLLIPAAYFTIVHAASVGSLRYRLPADAPMAIMAAAALPAVLRRRS